MPLAGVAVIRPPSNVHYMMQSTSTITARSVPFQHDRNTDPQHNDSRITGREAAPQKKLRTFASFFYERVFLYIVLVAAVKRGAKRPMEFSDGGQRGSSAPAMPSLTVILPAWGALCAKPVRAGSRQSETVFAQS